MQNCCLNIKTLIQSDVPIILLLMYVSPHQCFHLFLDLCTGKPSKEERICGVFGEKVIWFISPSILPHLLSISGCSFMSPPSIVWLASTLPSAPLHPHHSVSWLTSSPLIFTSRSPQHTLPTKYCVLFYRFIVWMWPMTTIHALIGVCMCACAFLWLIFPFVLLLGSKGFG